MGRTLTMAKKRISAKGRKVDKEGRHSFVELGKREASQERKVKDVQNVGNGRR